MSDPLLCDPAKKAELETRNGVRQLDYLSYVVNDLGARDIRESHVLELHKLCVEDVYPCGGSYRDARSSVHISGSDHTIPAAALVPGLVRELVERLNNTGEAAVLRAAYALWRFNWIHPFRGGNGRTARALTYLVLCMDMESMPPGTPSFPTIIYDKRKRYVECLKEADAADKAGGEDLSAMFDLVDGAITEQIAHALAKLKKPPSPDN